jgi:uncharacterized protein
MIKRKCAVSQCLKRRESIFLFGPRGVGKSYYLKDLLKGKKNVLQIDLLRTKEFNRYTIEPDLIHKEVEARLSATSGELIVYIDEIQRVPALLNEIHALIETHQKKLVFMLTGSSARKLKKGGANLLAGRALTQKMHPFSSLEVDFDIQDVLIYGTLPTVYLKKLNRKRYLKSYVDTYLKEEIINESVVRNIQGFNAFLEIAAQMNGAPINFSKIGKDCNLASTTVSDYYEILSDTLVAFRLNAWDRSVRQQVRKSPKFYFFDNGVLNTIRGELGLVLKPSSYRFGNLFESFIIQELIRFNDHFESDFKFYHWRTDSDLEVDCILAKSSFDQSPIAIEIKSSTSPSADDLAGLRAFKEEFPSAQCFCLCLSPRPIKIEDCLALPWQEGLKMIFKE